jgi:LCP family protein required for cell wall assembly
MSGRHPLRARTMGPAAGASLPPNPIPDPNPEARMNRRHSLRRSRAALAALTLAAVTLSGVAVAAGGGVAAAGARETAGASDPPAAELSRVHTGSAAPSRDGRLAFLVIGSDEGAPSFGRDRPAERGRADALQLVVLDATARRGVVIGFPRDSWVPIPGHRANKITAALALGGPDLLVRTVEELSGIPVDYHALTAFDRLITLVNGIGGVPVNIERRIEDPDSGADFHPGEQRLNGAQALAYARARKGVPGGDFGRSRHQGDMLLGGLAAFQGHLRAHPALLMRWLRLARKTVSTDLPFHELASLALFARSFPPGSIHNLVLPGAPGREGNASVVHLDPEAADVFAAAREGRFDDLPGAPGV